MSDQTQRSSRFFRILHIAFAVLFLLSFFSIDCGTSGTILLIGIIRGDALWNSFVVGWFCLYVLFLFYLMSGKDPSPYFRISYGKEVLFILVGWGIFFGLGYIGCDVIGWVLFFPLVNFSLAVIVVGIIKLLYQLIHDIVVLIARGWKKSP